MSRLLRLLPIAALLVAVLLVYLNHFQNGFHFDDGHAVVGNPAIRRVSNIPQFFMDARTFSILPVNQTYRPLVSTTLAIDYALGGGLNPTYFHLSTFLAYLIQLLVMGTLFSKILGNRVQAWLGVALYGLHPVQAETINYICQRADVYVALGLCLAMLLYVNQHRNWCLLPFAIAYFAKVTALVFPGLILAYEHFLGERNYRRAIPSIIVAALLLALNTKMTPSTYVLGAASPLAYRLTQPYIIMTYLVAAVAPVHLSADSDMQPFQHAFDPLAVAGYIGLVCLLAIIYKSKPAVSFGLCWFGIALVPTSLAALSDVTNDHRMFGAFVGLTLAVGALATTPRRRALLMAALPLLAWGTIQRNQVWKSDESLWLDVTQKCPRNGRGWMNYGLSLYAQPGRLQEALRALETAEPLTPNYVNVHINLGIVYAALQRQQEAEQHFQRALQLDPGGTPRFYYGDWLSRHGHLAQGVVMLREANQLNPADRSASRRLDEIFFQLKDLATQHPSCANYTNLSMVYYIGADYAKSLRAAQQASQLDPSNASAHNNQAACYLALKQWPQARDEARRALHLNPGNQTAQQNLRTAEKHMAAPSHADP